MITFPGCFADAEIAQTKFWVYVWKIVRTDGVTYRFTNFDKIITLDDGYPYSPVGGLNASARRREDKFREHEMEYEGYISSDLIKEADLIAGRFREAIITESVVDSRVPFMGPLYSMKYWLDDTHFDKVKWNANLSSVVRFLRMPVGDILTRNCNADLGDARCKVVLASYQAAGVVVDGLEDGERRRIIIATTASLAAGTDGDYDNGFVQFSSGLNNGLKGDIKSYTATSRRIELHIPMPYDIAPADTFTITKGCNKTKSICISKFSNGVNFRGSPFTPGTDRILQTPQR